MISKHLKLLLKDVDDNKQVFQTIVGFYIIEHRYPLSFPDQ